MAAETLEPRQLLASHPGFAHDDTGELVAVDAAVQAAVGDLLALISADYESHASPAADYSPPADVPGRELLSWHDGQGIAVTALAEPGQGASVAEALAGLGSTEIVAFGDHLSAWLPFGAIDALAAVEALAFADAAIEPVANSSLVNQAGLALEADLARARFGVDGSGIKIGVISDSFNNLGGYAFDVATGALPADVVVLKENPVMVEDGQPQPGSDEGRAMAQLVHSIAPGASLFFATAGNAPAVFADSIEQLVAAGCEIIVDDITEGGVPWFQDGIVALAVDAAVRDAGVTYLTAAGNFGRNSYGSDFRGVAAADLAGLPAELTAAGDFFLHDFDPGTAVDVFQRVTIPAGTTEIRLGLQWDQPWGANASDIDLFVYATDGQTLLDRLDGSHQTGGDPSISGILPVPVGLDAVDLVIAHTGGVAPTTLKYLTYHAQLDVEYAAGTSTIVAHANSATAAAVGASYYFRTPAYRQQPAELVPSSSWGGTPILLAPNGDRLPTAETRQQPQFVAPNIGDTSFFGQDVDLNGLPNFSGTSAAAPNAAAVAALMKQLAPALTPVEIFAILGETASGMPGEGGPFATGVGLINAEQALARAGGVAVAGTVYEDFNRDGQQGPDDLPLAAATVFLDLNGNGQLDRAPAAGATRAYVGFESSQPVAIGIREEIDNPNVPSTGPLKRPFTAISPVEVRGLPGVVTDLGVLFALKSDRVLEDEVIGPLFITLISPAGVRVPLLGTTVDGEGGADSPFDPLPTMLPADSQPYRMLVSQFATPVSEFTEGMGRARLSQVDLAAIVGNEPNGQWQLEVQSADSSPARTATLDSWELFLQTAEPTATTDAAGHYAFTGLPPASVAGPLAPRVVVPASRSLVAPQTGEEFVLAAGQSVSDANFALTVPLPVPRPPLRPAATIRIDQAVVGPQPVVFSWAELSAAVVTEPASDRFVVVQSLTGRVEKWDGSEWIDVSRPPASGSPQQLMADLASRVIQPHDRLHWVPPSGSPAVDQPAFSIIGWNGFTVGRSVSDISFEATPG